VPIKWTDGNGLVFNFACPDRRSDSLEPHINKSLSTGAS
jgi:hypothetical protein